ncbi:hypothetical protein Cgig2_003653 [Carnegiea gigantea]|uniref:Uncharacterized protein n=1 Tax=Carnegiea gigantea TaxID=171969 RepID=A0A9Q1GRV7_9CARY|nr:hypothetical protein Cgig2_003653 [Carnegiea gigantea]
MAGNECCERLAYYGMATNLVNYLIERLHQGNATASKNVIAIFSTIYAPLRFFLCVCVCARACVNYTCFLNLNNPKPNMSKSNLIELHNIFPASLILVALGTRGIKPCVSSFATDQLDETNEQERMKKCSFFNWSYFINSVLVWVQINVGWGWGFGIPAVALALAVSIWPGGSPLTRIAQVLEATFRKIIVKVPNDKSLMHEIADGNCLDKATVPTNTDNIKGMKNPWRLCTCGQTEIVFSTIYSQTSTMFVLQGNTLDQHIGASFKIPSASLSVFATLCVLFRTPVYDLIIPFARRIHPAPRDEHQASHLGIFHGHSNTLEVAQLNWMRKHGSLRKFDSSHLYLLANTAVLPDWVCRSVHFHWATGVFYDQALDTMRSLGSTLSLTLGNYLSSFLVAIVTNITSRHWKVGWIPDNLGRGHLDYFYWMLVILSMFNFLTYVWIAK